MKTYLLTVGLIFALMLGGIAVERLYRAFAARNPRLGPFRDSGHCGCCAAGSGCGEADRAEDGAQSATVPRN